MDVNMLREMYDEYEKNSKCGTLIEDNTIEPTIRKILNIMLKEKETLEKSLLNDAWKKIMEIKKATSETEDYESFLEASNHIYIDSKGKHEGNSEKLFTSLVMIGVNDIIVKKFN